MLRVSLGSHGPARTSVTRGKEHSIYGAIADSASSKDLHAGLWRSSNIQEKLHLLVWQFA